ncbi:hypothetical protein LCGC14_1285940 [marine sediment metagenome]|uniref:Uncharacterized protein n=1 Tax=marine sediment metagenome TaxID=412755 RepID=A0A0F9NAG6_9ZZZZ|nr:hypothetical protein [archaeon]
MILQGILNILDLYLTETELFYNDVDQYFQKHISNSLKTRVLTVDNIEIVLKDVVSFLIDRFEEFGLKRLKVKNRFSSPFIELKDHEKKSITSLNELYKIKLAPLIYEILMEQIVYYLVDPMAASILLNFRGKGSHIKHNGDRGFLLLEFLIEIKNLRVLFENSPEKMENLRKYIGIRDNVIIKFCSNKNKIESLEDIKNSRDKLQLLYLIHRIIDFFDIQSFFDFTHIKQYLEGHFEDCLEDIPLISLKNPDLCFCGIYLAQHLKIDIDGEKIKHFLKDVYEDQREEFEAPILEATDGLYYYFKSVSMANLELSDSLIDDIVKVEKKFFTPSYLREIDTSQLVIILKIYNLLGILNRIDPQNIKAIKDEIESRITPDGIKQSRDGFVTSEATYYVLFYHYINDTLDKLKDHDILNTIISRIYRNIELLDFSIDMSHDLISEVFYSCESLRLFNCIETKEMIIHLAKHMFPQEVVDKILASDIESRSRARFRHTRIDRITGEAIY